MYEDYEMISSYTRKQAIEDGVLVDVSHTAKDAGFVCPVAVTDRVWHDITHGPSKNKTDIAGRLWDVIYMLLLNIRKQPASGGCIIYYDLIMPVEGVESEDNLYRLKSIAGLGDEGELVITIMLPNED